MELRDETIADINPSVIDPKKNNDERSFPWNSCKFVFILSLLAGALIVLSAEAYFKEDDLVKSLFILGISTTLISITVIYCIKAIFPYVIPRLSNFKVLEEIPEI
jgi:hypothetical protein